MILFITGVKTQQNRRRKPCKATQGEQPERMAALCPWASPPPLEHALFLVVAFDRARRRYGTPPWQLISTRTRKDVSHGDLGLRPGYNLPVRKKQMCTLRSRSRNNRYIKLLSPKEPKRCRGRTKLLGSQRLSIAGREGVR